ncbi:hypothetical protein BU14_0251s0011 [Porphyra umbilicalis]|uniref:Uncharacterized protein n=1 Tax=Porphyra umbilicalis TaxID=2786 RepID=A0A1X6P2S8_PORUM|nr:hypothetical protein BU14_0251s0011 [Porphyra umbilicalis]|eukprot:OSX75171.1 hypothetical protein BU14_0251s0011 [Porphyra umbilicalis]
MVFKRVSEGLSSAPSGVHHVSHARLNRAQRVVAHPFAYSLAVPHTEP